MNKKPTKAAAKVIAKAQQLIDDLTRFEAEHPGAFDRVMAGAAAASAKVRAKKAKKKESQD